MSLDKAIEHGKEHRKPYRGSGRFDMTCRPHSGGKYRTQCPWCSGNRLFARLRLERIARAEE